jgi:hypothetical protein
MTDSIPLSDLESANSAKFESIGDVYEGKIMSIDHRQQTDPKTGEKKFFPSGDPMMLFVISIKPDGADAVALWAKGGRFEAKQGEGESMLSAIGTAARAAEATTVEVGGTLAVKFTGLGEAKPGMNAPKLFRAQYRAPVQSIGADDLFSS